MLWLWILLAAALLIILLCWTRVGVWAAFGEGTFRLDAQLGLLRIHILPLKAKKPKAKRSEEERKPPKKKEKAGKPQLSITLEDVRDALHTMLPPLGRALSRTRRGIRVKPLRFSLILGGQEDPAAAAQLYGELQAAIWTGMPVLERLVDIRDICIHTGVDFTAPAPAAEGETGITFRIGTLLAVGFGLAFPAVKWFFRWRSRCKGRLRKPEKKSQPEGIPPEKPQPKEPAA